MAEKEEHLEVEVEGLHEVAEEEEKDEDYDASYPENNEGEINEGEEPFWLRAEDIEEDTREAKDLTDFSVQVSVEFLQSLGLQKHAETIQSRRVGIESLVNMDSETMAEFIKDPTDRALIIGRAKKTFVRASPPKVDNRPVKVMVKFGIGRISEINTVDLTARIKVFVDLFWNDHRMIGARKDQVPSYIWIPDCYVYNCTQRSGENGGKLNMHPVSLLDSDTGMMFHALELEVVLSNEMDLRRFPFDSDSIVLHLMQEEFSSAEEWILVPWEGGEGTENSVKCFWNIYDTPEFDLHGFSLDFFRSYPGGSLPSISQCLMKVHIARRPFYYIRNILIPIVLTTTLAFTAFFYDINEVEARNNGTATTFLTTVAFLYVLTSLLPKTNYDTSINSAVVLSFVVQLVIWALTNINFLLAKTDPDNAFVADQIASIALPILYYGLTILLFTPKVVRWSYRTRNSKPPAAELDASGYKIRDWRLPVFEKRGELRYFPFIQGQNVYP